MSNEIRLGVAPDEGAGRDSVHVPVIPVTAQAHFRGGSFARLVPGTTDQITRCYAPEHVPIGVVDPFLPQDFIVEIGQKVWLCLLPGSITSLRHEWRHPAFDPEAVVPASERWLREFGAAYGIVYNDLLYYAAGYLNRGEYLTRGAEFEGESVPDEFWDHYEKVTGAVVPANLRGSFFSCSCT